MLSFILCLNMDLNSYIKAQKSSLEWWFHLYIGRYCWMNSTIASCLLLLGTKRCMLCCLLMCGGLLKDATMGFVSIQTVCFELWVDLYRAWI